jgi:hypothetical protein
MIGSEVKYCARNSLFYRTVRTILYSFNQLHPTPGRNYVETDFMVQNVTCIKEKKKKYLNACLDQQRSYVPFVVSTDGLLGREAKNLVKQIALRLTAKWEPPYSVIRGFVNARINLAILRATNLCIRGSRVPASKMSKRVQWLDGAGLGLFETV